MANSLADLNNHLFAALERLNRADLDAEALDRECKRATAVVAVADQVSTIAKHQIDAAKLFATHGEQVLQHLPQIGSAVEKSKP